MSYQPQYPTAPPVQQYPPPPVQQPYPQPLAPQYPQQVPGPYPQQGYPAPPQQPPAQPLAQGTLDDFYNQPSAGSGPSLSWTDKQSNQPKPIGTSYIGVVTRDVTNADVQQQTDFRTQAPLFYRDGRPKYAMKVPLKVMPSPEFPEGEATWFVKGQARDELTRAMAEAHVDGSPKAGALIQVTLVQRRNTGAGMNPANVVQVVYTPPGQQPGQAPQQQAQPVQDQPVQQAPQQEQPPAWAQPIQQQVPLAQPVQQPVPQFAPQQPVQQQVPAQAPQQQAAQPPAPPSDLSPEQQRLLATLTGGQPQS